MLLNSYFKFQSEENENDFLVLKQSKALSYKLQ